jgi:hypothetical protein
LDFEFLNGGFNRSDEMIIDEALLLFNKWWSERTPITCTFVGGGLQMRFTGTIDTIEAGSILMHTGDDAAFLHMPLHSVHEFRYCDPRELDEPDAEERFVGFLIMRLMDGNVLQFAEPK